MKPTELAHFLWQTETQSSKTVETLTADRGNAKAAEQKVEEGKTIWMSREVRSVRAPPPRPPVKCERTGFKWFLVAAVAAAGERFHDRNDDPS